MFWTTDPFEAVTAEISAALRITRQRAGTQIRYARALRDRFPQVAALLAAGLIDFRIVLAIIFRTQNVRAEVCQELDAMLARHAGKWMRLSENKLHDHIDEWVIKLDPNGQRVPTPVDDSRHITVEPGVAPGVASIWANVHAEDAAAFDQELNSLARTVCKDDPRTHAQRRADALGPLSRREAQLPCRCGLDDCPAKQTRAAAEAAVIHVLANQSTLTGDSNDPGYLPGYGILPADTVRHLAANAKCKPVVIPTNSSSGDRVSTSDAADTADNADAGQTRTAEATGAANTADTAQTGTADAADTDAVDSPSGPVDTDTAGNSSTPDAEPGYRPSVALREFIYWRDLTCRFPGCDAPAMGCDVDHTVPYPHGPTHPSNLKMYCRAHHLVKTFITGWSDRQLPDGTIEFTTPTGHTHHTTPHGAELFPTLAQPTGELDFPENAEPQEPETPSGDRSQRTMKMPRRSKTREQQRLERIEDERQERSALNTALQVEHDYQAWIAEHHAPPPPF
ncbi:HNH endonuclease [Mycobacterium sp. TNTM28]|uniref:HNH endonuclease n=1 Tax=[Mycobacterium] fortunisiensis TaxID=2600579 RepID=A0ABS6KQF3_9MYCO|nr:HNH endonuclease [[Mycobacterium] fortunisiensis]